MASHTNRAVSPFEASPGRSVSDQATASEHNSDADLAERHAAALAGATSRPMGLLERQDSANYEPRPPAMTERQDSAQNLQAMEEEMAELTATGAPPAEAPVSREDSAHDMTQAQGSQGLQLQGVSRLSDSQSRASAPGQSAARTDSANEAGHGTLPASSSGLPSSRAVPASAFMCDSASDERGSPLVAAGRQDSAGEERPGPRSVGGQQGSARRGAPAVRAAGFVRDSASEEPGGLGGPGTGPRGPVPPVASSRQGSAGDEVLQRLADVGRRDSASEQPAASSSGSRPSQSAEAPQTSAMGSAPSLQVARALILGNPATSPRTASQQLACSPRDELISRQDSALDSLVAARHAVLADLAQSARPGTPAETASAFSHGELLPAVGSSGCCRRDEQPVLDPLMQARALVQSHFASSSSLPTPFLPPSLLDGMTSAPSLEAARMAVLGPSYSGSLLRPGSANSGSKQRSQESRGKRRWQSFGGARGEALSVAVSNQSALNKGKAVAHEPSMSGVRDMPNQSSFAAGHAESSPQCSGAPALTDQPVPVELSAAGPSSLARDDYVDFMGRLSMDEVRRLSSADAAQRAHVISGFRQAMEASSSEGPAGVGGTSGSQGDPIAAGTSTVHSFGSSRHADSGLPDTPMSAAGSSHNPRLTQQDWGGGQASATSSGTGAARRLSSGYDSAHEQ
ncbi:hypothetical protein CVIRNUC_008329 [Coccomyxa viridis]|uniref:Uncharacterized protein n=1 Tax=Coccomyxa viridis TaxID=1274662 RepID=A0AAV1ID12_9CHLO|nr:hypothetical protein CVIRNUC_008329 [Coccomyxa viridis]